MANFKTHLGVGMSSSAVLSASLLSMDILTPNYTVVAFAIGTLGSLLPDIDADNSKAIEVAFSVISILVTIVLVFSNAEVFSIIELLIFAGVIFSTIRFGFIDIFRKISKHRGMFHSIPVALIWGLGTTVLAYKLFNLPSLVSWIYGLMMSFGYLVHLTLDEIYSVDLGNRRIKKSFGTALKLYTKNSMQTILIYAVLVILIFMTPDFSLVKSSLLSYDAWVNFKYSLLPSDGKWFFH